MATKLFVGSLSWGVNDDQLSEFFSSVGTVASAKVIVDHDSGRSKGFGFVEMSNDEEAKAAVEKLNNAELDGRSITVSEARPREERPRNNNYGGGGDRGGNRGGGDRGGYNDRRY
jgi:RNA recognition motif-containing protein